jgi:Trp operon repressor
MKSSATSNLMRRINSSAVLDLIRQESPIAQSQISRKLNISIPTVMRISNSLMAEDWCVCLAIPRLVGSDRTRFLSLIAVETLW